MQFDKNATEREVLISYMEQSGVTQQKQAAAIMREDEARISHLNDELSYHVKRCANVINFNGELLNKLEELEALRDSICSRVLRWFK